MHVLSTLRFVCLFMKKGSRKYPDFDSKRREKEAATPEDKGIVAFMFLQKYVGDRHYFLLFAKIFFISLRRSLFRVKSISKMLPMASEISLL